MSLPRVTITFAHGALLADVGSMDGMAGIVGTGSTTALLCVPTPVYNLDDAIAKKFTEAAEPSMYRHLKEYYAEVAGNKRLVVMIVPETVSMKQMLDNTHSVSAKLLTKQFPDVRLLGITRAPSSGYAGGAGFIDSDVSEAISVAKTFGEARLAENSPVRILLEGRVQNADAANTLTPNTSSNGYVGAVLGGTLPDGSASVGLALGRACKYEAHVKIGKVANGPLSVDKIYIGDVEASKSLAQESYNDAGFITFMTYPHKAGYYFAADRMCTKDDYRLLALGRVVDKAAVIASAFFTEEIENEVDVDEEGKIASHAAFHLEERIKQQLSVAMGHQMSGEAQCKITSKKIVSTGELSVSLRVRPKGYTTYINVNLGFLKT